MQKYKFPIFICILLFSINTLFASSVKKTFRKTIPFKSNGEIILENRNGSIEIDSWNKNEVYIYAEIKVTAPSRSEARDFIDEVEIVINERSGMLEIYADYPYRRSRSRGFLSSLFRSGRINVSVSYRLSVPKISSLDLQSSNGKIEVYDIEGRVDTKTSNGTIRVERINGTVNAETTNGAIVAEVLETYLEDNMNFHTTNGSIKVYLPRNIKADLYARTTNGRVHCEFPLDSRSRYRDRDRYRYDRYRSRRNLQGSINGGGINIELRTTNGGISILEL